MTRQLQDWLTSYMEYTNNSEPPDSFRLWTAISVIAAALRRKCSLLWGASPIYPNMYIVLVGPSGCRKGTAMGPGYGMLRKLGVNMAAEAITREALIRELKGTTDTCISTDGSKGMHMHSSLTIFSQELTVFLGYNNMQLMSDLCDWFDCRDIWTYRTKSQGTDEIHGVWVNLIGATTPELIITTLPQNAIGTGLTSRIILISESRKGKIVPIPNLTKDEIEMGHVLQSDLEKISMMSGEFKVSEDFIEYWIQWYTNQNHKPPFEDLHFTGYLERRGIHTLKLSMICSVSRSNSMVIHATDLKRAISLLEGAEKNMRQVFSGVGKSPTSDIVTTVLRWVATVGTCSLTELMNRYYQDADKKTMLITLDTLESMKVIKQTHTANDVIIKHIGGKDGIV